MHGTVMIFLAVVPLLVGAFGNYLVPLQLGASDMVFPRLNAASYWTYLIAGLLMLASFFVGGGAANSGWTSYPPLAVLATRGQDFWLVGIFLLGVSSMLNSITMVTTIVQARAPGLTFMRLPFFVWAQLIAALLLLMAFPALQAAVVYQLMDRLAGTSFFLPSRDVVHGFTLLEMRVKQDATPGMTTRTWFTATRPGEWQIGCSQLCGLGHYRMRGTFTVLFAEEWEQWLKKESPIG